MKRLLALLGFCTTMFISGCGGGADTVTSIPEQLPNASAPAKSLNASAPNYNPDQLYQFFAVAFNAAPGVTYMGQLLDAANSGLTVKQIVNIFTTKSQFTDAYPQTMTNNAFATKLVDNVVGSSASAQAKQSAVNDVIGALSLPGWTRGDVIFAIFSNLAGKPSTDPDWAGTSKKLANQVVYAKYFTEDLLIDTTNLLQLRNAVSAADETTDTFQLEQNLLSTLDTSSITNSTNSFATLQLKNKAFIGSDFSVSWTASNNYQCAFVSQKNATYSTSNTVNVKSIEGGQHRYSFKCTNGTIKTNQIVTLITPMKVYPTSYENKINLKLDFARVPILEEISGIVKEVGEFGTNLRALAFADFLQNGTYTAIIASTMYKGIEGNINKQPDAPAKLYFIQQNSDGKWKDISDQLFTSSVNRYTCASPGFIEIADFNNDGKPDAVMSCSGPDFMVNGVYPNPSTPQVTLISRADGKYDISSLGTSLSTHQLAAADINNDGNIDVIATDGYNYNTPVIFWGKGDGSFIFDKTRFPDDMKWKSIFGIRALPIDGSLKILVSGNPRGTWPDASDANFGSFELIYNNSKFEYLKDYSNDIPVVTSGGLKWGLADDVIYLNGYYYFLRVNFDNSKNSVVKTNRISGLSTVVYETDRNNWSRSDTSGVITFDKNGNIVSQVAGCSIYAVISSDYYHNTCYMSVKP